MLDKIAGSIWSDTPQVDPNSSCAATALMATLEVLERSRVPYVVLHGYENFPEVSGTDVDICIDQSASSRFVCTLLNDNAKFIGARVVSCRNGAILLAGESGDNRVFFLKLDIDHDYVLNGLCIVPGQVLLAARRRHEAFHVPSPAHQLAGHLASSMIKKKLDVARTNRLSQLYNSDPVGSAREIARLWSSADSIVLQHALADNNWKNAVAAAPRLAGELVSQLRGKNRFGRSINAINKFSDRLQRLISPRGLSVVVLGPDGAGKSSITDAVGGPDLLPIFDRSVCWGFVPPLHRLIGRSQGPSSQPHALAARSTLGSLIKAGYWLAFSILSHPRTYLMKARGGLVLYDRHFVDILVDPKRYRYNGPSWILRAIWLMIPKPDIVVLLDAPAETIHQRKQELSVEETARQLAAYRKLVGAMPNGVILNANRPFPKVVDAVNLLLFKQYQSAEI